MSLIQRECPVALIAAPNKGHELPAAQKLLRSEAVNLFLFTSSFFGRSFGCGFAALGSIPIRHYLSFG